MLSKKTRLASTAIAIRGAMVQESYSILAAWDGSLNRAGNIERIRDGSLFPSASASWTEKVKEAFVHRFDPDTRDMDCALALLARNGMDMEKWKPLLLWHLVHMDGLLQQFLEDWLFGVFDEGALRVQPADLHVFLRGVSQQGKINERAWSESTLEHVSLGLLKIAVDFGLMKGKKSKEFATYHLPEESFLFVLHSISERKQNARRIIESPSWRVFLMRPGDVERELARLHQYQKLEYQAAGSLAQISLPCRSALEYAERIVG